MKMYNLALAVLGSVAFTSCTTIGNGNIITDERKLPSFNRIMIEGIAEVRFHTSTEYRAVVSIDSNLNEYFQTTVRNEVLIIKYEPSGPFSSTKEIADIYCPNLTDISISGAGRFEAIDTITSPVFKVNISGAGAIYGTIKCEAFSAGISGTGEINIKGNTQKAEISISGSGDFNAAECIINDCSIEISGSGRADMYVEDTLSGTISGAGRIKYRGKPEINFRNSGSGSVEKVE